MKTARFLSAGMVLALLIAGPAAAADGWSLEKLNPFAKKEASRSASRSSYARSYHRTQPKPSPLESIAGGTKQMLVDTGNGAKKLVTDTGAGAGRLLTGAKDALTWKKPAPRRRPANRYMPWTGRSDNRQPKDQKLSWMDRLLGRQEPKPIESLDDWWALKRMDP